MEDWHEKNVSRETYEKLKAFEALVQKWNPSINLIAKSTLVDIWERHIVDSMQLFKYAPQNVDNWLDIGSGGGFPGIVMAIMADGVGRKTKFTLIESDQRKAMFLRTAARELGLNVTVTAERIEAVDPSNAEVVTARALKSLSELFHFLERHLAKKGVAILPKGMKYQEEIREASRNWTFDLTEHVSTTNMEARILVVKDIKRD